MVGLLLFEERSVAFVLGMRSPGLRDNPQRFESTFQSFRTMRKYAKEVSPLRVKSRHSQCKTSCPLYPRKRTCAVQLGMSPQCQ